ncbi:protein DETOXIFICATION 53-like [Tasmannia lanceolata]|uniref:protein DETOXIFICATION 53-like n=1 Tax=Tasmannia lanceolata TaxID=3420 RepID=UPI0040641647
MCPNKDSICNEYLVPKDGGGGGGEKLIHSSTRWPILNEVVEELIPLGKLTFPILITSLLFYSRSIISMLFLGHLGEIELAGGSLSIGFANITGYSIIKGLAMGMEPICCQAYGAKKWAVMIQTFRKTFFLLSLATIPIVILWLFMEPILLHLGQDPTITSVARVYITFSIPELLAQVPLQPLRIFLRTQSLTTPLTISTTIALILHFPINYILVVYLNLGVKGVALASAWNTLNLNLGLLVYLAFLSKSTLKPWNCVMKTSWFEGWRPLLALAIPSMVSVCLEWWWYEVMVILCGLLKSPRASVAAMGILIQTTSLIYIFPYSLSLGLSTRVGLLLGAGRPDRARLATWVGLGLAFTCGFLAFAFTIVVKDGWGKLFTCEPHILELTSIVLPIIGFCEIWNSPQTAGCGVLRGSARLKVGVKINFGSFYLIGIPVAALFCFMMKVGFRGLWFGLVAAQVTCLCMMLSVVLGTDWEHQAERAKELTEGADTGKGDLEANLLH